MKKLSLRWRLMLAAAAIVLPAMLLLGVFIHLSSRRYMLDVATDNLRGQAQLAARQISGLLARTQGGIDADSLADSIGAVIGRRVTVIDSTGRVIGDSDMDAAGLAGMDNHLGRPEIREAGLRGWGYSIRYSHTLKKDMVYLAVPIILQEKRWGYCRVAWPMSAFYSHQKSLAAIIVLGLLASGILLMAAFGRLWQNIITDIGRVAQAAQRLIEGDLSARSPTGLGSPEIERISLTLNRLAESWGSTSRELGDRNLKLSAILNSMSEGVVVVDAEHRVSLVNRAFAEMLGLQGDVSGRLLLELIRHPGVQELLAGDLEELVFEHGGRHFLARASSLVSQRGLVVVLSDITRLKRLEQVRRDFVANVSHELKTPLSAVIGYLEALQDGTADSPEVRNDFIRRLRLQARRMARLVDDLLDLAVLESSTVSLSKDLVHAKILAEKAADNLAPTASAKGQKIVLADSEHWQTPVPGDEPRLVQALSNLLDNAVKYSPEGSAITIDCHLQNGFLVFSVNDEGPGISDEHLPRLFERFYRVDKSRSRELGGTGLGLAIVKHIVELHGGRVGVESRPGRGSRFWISLPLADRIGTNPEAVRS